MDAKLRFRSATACPEAQCAGALARKRGSRDADIAHPRLIAGTPLALHDFLIQREHARASDPSRLRASPRNPCSSCWSANAGQSGCPCSLGNAGARKGRPIGHHRIR